MTGICDLSSVGNGNQFGFKLILNQSLFQNNIKQII